MCFKSRILFAASAYLNKSSCERPEISSLGFYVWVLWIRPGTEFLTFWIWSQKEAPLNECQNRVKCFAFLYITIRELLWFWKLRICSAWEILGENTHIRAAYNTHTHSNPCLFLFLSFTLFKISNWNHKQTFGKQGAFRWVAPGKESRVPQSFVRPWELSS